MVPLKIVSNVSRFKPAQNLNRVLADFGGFKPRLKFFKFHLWSLLITSAVPLRKGCARTYWTRFYQWINKFSLFHFISWLRCFFFNESPFYNAILHFLLKCNLTFLLQFNLTFSFTMQSHIFFYNPILHFLLQCHLTFSLTVKSNIFFYSTIVHFLLQCNLTFSFTVQSYIFSYSTILHYLLQCNLTFSYTMQFHISFTMQYYIFLYNAISHFLLQCNLTFSFKVQSYNFLYYAI